MSTGIPAEVKVTPLGAGCEVGRSCVLINIGDALIMADCGMHMGYRNYKKFPDFSMIAEGDLTKHIDVVLLSHFHLDHCGSLPFFTEKVGYNGPLFMTAPTHAIAPLLLHDMVKVMKGQRRSKRDTGDDDPSKDLEFNANDIVQCMSKATVIGMKETVELPEKGIRITAYYAGHVLGACMFHIEVHGVSVLYTGDYNTSSDRHLLGAHVVPGLRPHVMITESTYGSTVRDSRRQRERDFLTLVHDTVRRGGKVLIPVFAMGRAQELLILLETFWTRMKIDVPIYFSAGMVGRANEYYKLYTSWTSDAVRGSFASKFEFPNISVFSRNLLDAAGPCVLFSSPGMLHAGASLEAFKHWCTDEKNTVIIPGFCVEGTIGHTVLTSENPKIVIDDHEYVVRCTVSAMSFSAHADGRGILRLVQSLSPEYVVLVHGDYEKAMKPLQRKIELETGIPCKMPKNGSIVKLRLSRMLIPVAVDASLRPVASKTLLRALSNLNEYGQECLRHMAQARKVRRIADKDGGGDVHTAGAADGSNAVSSSPSRWWEQWGVCVEDYADPAVGPSALDCGCDLAWEEKLKATLDRIGPKHKYLPVADAVAGDPWGTVQTFPIVIAATPAADADAPAGQPESISTVVAHEAMQWLKDMHLARHNVVFKASIPAPKDAPAAPPETLIPAMHTAIAKCSPGVTFAVEEDAGVPTRIVSGSIVITVTAASCEMQWQHADKVAAMRAHACISDTWGVAV